MSDYHIRLYKDSDFVVVKELFASGILEHTGTSFRHAISVPRNILSMLVMVLVSHWISGSVVVPVLVVVTALRFLWLCSRHIYSSYVEHSLADDMVNVEEYYLRRGGYCFWVAESGGEVVGAVAAVPAPVSVGEKRTELKRLTIAKEFRGRGIGKVLCRTVIDFARQSGCVAVVLETSMPQGDAVKLYERMGFHKTHTIRQSDVVAAVPSPHSGGEKRTELRRMTVAKKYRGRGIATALCRAVIDFAQQTGCAAVILETSLIMKDAHRLYERVGFRVTHTIHRPHFRYRLFDFVHFHYQYDIPTCK
uniref:N-acetyltransferase domain-containing protein n=1 Tax=Leptobrachium leishanense TaxID=445787 RepID=A0A8C5LGQ1_9ANUR